MDLERQQMDLEHKKADVEHKKAATEQLLALGRLHKEGQLTDVEFAQSKANLLLPLSLRSQQSPTNEFQGRSPVATLPQALIEDANFTRSGVNLEPGALRVAGEGLGVATKDAGSMETQSLRLRRELNGLKPKALLRRAKQAGATAHVLERADQAALVEMIVRKDDLLRWELGHLTEKDLWQRASFLALARSKIEEAEESTHDKDALIELVARADQRDVVQHQQYEAVEPAGALDQILVHLRTNTSDLGHTARPNSAIEPIRQSIDESTAKSKHVQIETAIVSVPTHNSQMEGRSMTEHSWQQLTTEQAPLLKSIGALEDANTATMRTQPRVSISDRQKELMDTFKFKELHEMLHQLGTTAREIDAAVEEAENPRLALVELVMLYEAKVGPVGALQRLSTVASQRHGVPPPLPSSHRNSTTASPHSTYLREAEPQALCEPEQEPFANVANGGTLIPSVAEPSPAPATDDEDQAVLKVQAMWRGKTGQKKAAEERHTTVVGSDRIVASKRTIRGRQAAVTLLVMLTTTVCTLLPNYLIGALYGAVENGDGIDGGIALNYGIRVGVFFALVSYMQMDTFEAAMRDTTFVPGSTERVVRPLLAAAAGFFFYASNWRFVNIEDPESDIAFVKGLPGLLGFIASGVGMLPLYGMVFEFWRLYRARNLRLPPANVATWWKTTAIAGRGTLATAFSLSAYLSITLSGYWFLYLGTLSIFDKPAAIAELGDGDYLNLWFFKYFWVITLPFMLLAVLWAKPWPRGTRDPVSAVVLGVLLQAGSWEGSFTAFHLYSWLGGPNGSTILCQIVIEVLMLLVYLYARTLARKAFGTAPAYEARTLFTYLLLSDGPCKGSSVNALGNWDASRVTSV
jgi:hypothetical protein